MMTFISCKVSLCLLWWALAVNGKGISESLDDVFLNQEPTLDDSKAMLASARDSYMTLKDYQKVKEPEMQAELLPRLRAFTQLAIDDLSEEGMSPLQLFDNINSYLKDDAPANVTIDPMALAVRAQRVLAELDRKLVIHHSSPQGFKYDVEVVLSGSTEQNVFRAAGVDGTTIGYFFLESFATILGLAWGIISMIMSNSQE